MIMVRFRLIGSRCDVDAVIAGIHGVSGIEHVEEIDDLSPRMRDDSSSSDSVSDSEGQVYCVEVEAPTDQIADTARGCAEMLANERDAGIEFVDEF